MKTSLRSSSLRASRKRLFAITLAFVVLSLSAAVFGQESSAAQSTAALPQPLITQAVNETQLTVFKGNTHPLARPQFDLGTAPATLPMQRMLLVLKRSPAQEAALRKLLDDQQDKHSPSYHKWLTPSQYGKQFGPTDSDMQTITAWLQSYGFQVGTTKGRTVLEFSGSASQVQQAFHTAIHKYVVNGEQHWANSSDPSIPTALTPAVAGIDSFHNFGRKRMSSFFGVVRKEKDTGKITVEHRELTFPSPQNPCNAQDTNCYVVGPYDFATIYSVLPLWNTGVDGTGQRIGIVQNSNINIADAQAFRTMFTLPANDPNIILDGPDPGALNPGQFGGESEADLDVEWSGAVAKGAAIDLVVSADTDTTAGIDLSATYIIENNVDPIMSESFGECEAFLTTGGNQFYNAIWEQAASQGISVFVSSGDEGSASCDRFQGSVPQPAVDGLAVSGIASTPFNVAVGGTDFQDVFNPQTYWTVSNNANQASALGYIPETTWNDSCTNALFADIQGGSTNAESNCNNSTFASAVIASGGSGGASNCEISTINSDNSITCNAGYPKPSWQSGVIGTQSDTVRDIPDVSLFASNGFEGNFYVFCQGDITLSGSCDLNAPYADFGGVGGTSASSPAMAGIMALVNQQMGSRQGNPNYVLYRLATLAPAAFNDVTAGTIRVPCQTGSLDCTTTTGTDAIGIINGFDAGPGFDLATGLGSVNAFTLVTDWNLATFTGSATTLVLNGSNAVNVMHGTAVPVQVSVVPTSGTGTPTGDVVLFTGSGAGTSTLDLFNLTGGLTTAASTSALPGGTSYSVWAHYSGDTTFAPSDSNKVSVTVSAEASMTTMSVQGFDQNGNLLSSPFPFGSVVFARADVASKTQGSAVCQSLPCPTGLVTFVPIGGTFPSRILGLTTTIANPVSLNSNGNAAIGSGIINFDAGNYNISASYAGDPSFGASASAQPAVFAIQPGFIAVSGLANVTIASPGGSGTTTVGFIASTGLATPVSFTCSGLPSESTCSGSGTGQGPSTIVNANITVTTTAPHTTMLQPNQRPYYFALIFGGGIPLAGIFLLAAPRRRRWSALLGLLVIAMLVTLPACGGGSKSTTTTPPPVQDPGTPAGTYNVTVTATGGTLSQQVGTFTLTLQ